jgi:hypothetical protein
MLAETCRAPVSFLMGMLSEDYFTVEHDEDITFATVYLEHDRFVPPMVRSRARVPTWLPGCLPACLPA